MSATPKKFKVGMSGADIFELLQSVSDKLNADAITQDLGSESESEVLSAAVTNSQLTILRGRTSGEGVKQMLDKAPGVHALTDELLNKIGSLELVFIGSMGIADRDALDTSELKGGEVLLLLNSIDASGKLQYWDRTTGEWKTASVLEGYRNAATALSAGVTVIQTLDKNAYRTASFTVSCRAAGEMHIIHYTLGWEGNDTFINSYGDVRNGDELFSVTTEVAAGGVDIKATTTKANSRIQIEVHSVY